MYNAQTQRDVKLVEEVVSLELWDVCTDSVTLL